jgi:hypothetical protein
MGAPEVDDADELLAPALELVLGHRAEMVDVVRDDRLLLKLGVLGPADIVDVLDVARVLLLEVAVERVARGMRHAAGGLVRLAAVGSKLEERARCGRERCAEEDWLGKLMYGAWQRGDVMLECRRRGEGGRGSKGR